MSYIVKEHNSKRKYKYEMISNLVSAFFILLLRNHEDHFFKSHIVTDAKNEKKLEVIKYIQSNSSSITLSMVAQKFSYSERQISRIVKSFTSYSFSEFLANVRLARAKKLIQNTNITIETIAYSVGYADQSKFYRQFKKKFGCSPASFR